jgi:Leucine-rich repeat (LRR) protein
MFQAMPSLQRLTELDLSFNQLQNLPFGIGWLSSLKLLHLVRNRISSFPDSIRGCQSLMELHAGAYCCFLACNTCAIK